MRLPRSKLTTKIITFALIAYAGAALISIWTKTVDVGEVMPELRDKVTEMEIANAELEYAIENHDDPDVIADIARENLGLALPGEIILYDDSTPLSSEP